MNGKGSLTRYLWLVSSIFIITTFFVYFYYLETERKEDYFNKLYFRQLVEISSNFEVNLVRLLNFSREADKNSAEIIAALQNITASQAQEAEGYPAAEQSEYSGILLSLQIQSADINPKSLHEEVLYSALSEYEDVAFFMDLSQFTKFQCDEDEPTASTHQASVVRYCHGLEMLSDSLQALNRLTGQEAALDAAKALQKISTNLVTIEEEADAQAEGLAAHIDMAPVVLVRILRFLKDLQESRTGSSTMDVNELQEIHDVLREVTPEVVSAATNTALAEELRRLFDDQSCLICDNAIELPEEEVLTAEISSQYERLAQILPPLIYASALLEIGFYARMINEELKDYIVLKDAAGAGSNYSTQDLEQQLKLLQEARAAFLYGEPMKMLTKRHSLKPSFMPGQPCPPPLRKDEKVPEDSSGKPRDYEAQLALYKHCSGLLFVGNASKRTPYPGSNIAVRSYLANDGAIETPLEHLLPSQLWGFSSLLVARSSGEVVIQRNERSDDITHNFVNIENILTKALAKALPKSSSKDGKDNPPDYSGKVLAHTLFVDEEIGGIMHRIYIYPYNSDKLALRFGGPQEEQNEYQLYFVGLKPLAEIRAETLRISPRTSAVLLAAALIILLAFVFLKIQLAHPDAAFTRLEAFLAGFSLVFLVLIVLVGVITLSISRQLDRETKYHAEATINKLKASFADELSAYVYRVDGLLKSNPNLVKNLASGSDSEKLLTGHSNCLVKRRRGETFLSRNPPIVSARGLGFSLEYLFMLNREGRISGDLVRGSEYTASPTNPDLSQRRYFVNALTHHIWEVMLEDRKESPESCDTQGDRRQASQPGESPVEKTMQQIQRVQSVELALNQPANKTTSSMVFPLVLERIFNLTDGNRNTQFALPVSYRFKGGPGHEQLMFDAKTRYNINTPPDTSGAVLPPEVITFGVTMRTFHAPVLPAGLQFAVVDNASGAVQYHSNDERSLVENFFQETDNNAKLQAYIRASEALTLPDDKHSPSFSQNAIEKFSGMYRGNNTKFWSAKLHPDIPWTIVVFDDKGDRQSLVTLVFGIAILVCTGIVLLVCLILLVPAALNKHPLRWLWPQEDKFDLYPKLSVLGLGLAAMYFVALYSLDNLLYFVIAVTLSTPAIVFLFHRIFSMSDTAIENAAYRRSHLPIRYNIFICTVLILVAAVPAAIGTRLIGKEVLLRATFYESILYTEARQIAAGVSEQRLQRLCGNTQGEGRPYRACASLFGRAPQNDAEEWRVDPKVLSSVRRPTHTIHALPCDGNWIFCSEVKPKYLQREESGAFDAVLLPLERLWDLPVLFDVLEPSGPVQSPPLALGHGDESYYLHFHYPGLRLLLTHSPWLVFGGLLVGALVGLSAVNFLATKLLGIKVPRSYRSGHVKLDSASWGAFTLGQMHTRRFSGDDQKLLQALTAETPHHGILIRPENAKLSKYLDHLQDAPVRLKGNARVIDALHLSKDETLRNALFSTLATNTQHKIVLVNNFEGVAFNANHRLILLATLERLVNLPQGPSVVLLCEVAPLYMLTNQSRYIPNSMAAEYADAQECIRWARLLSSFTKYYGWSPAEIEFTDADPWENSILREVSAWPELYALKPQLDELKSEKISLEQALQYILTHAGPHYRRRWSLCTKEEKLLLYQLAKGQIVNPANLEPLEHLLRRGYVRRDPEWMIVNQSFARFVLTAEDETVYTKWVKASEQGLWKVLRVPLFTSALVILGILMYSAQEAIESLLALATSVLALLPLLLRNVSLVRGTQPPQESS